MQTDLRKLAILPVVAGIALMTWVCWPESEVQLADPRATEVKVRGLH